jgi:hypothetical protein
MDMAIQRDVKDEREARMDILIERFQEAEKRDLLTRGITLWTRAERQLGIVPFDATLPPNKIN